jgi:putative FmdB family regulatory protein
MPIYEYQCEVCGYKLETIQKVSDPPRIDCPKCHKPGLKKMISAAGFRLKGGGWYETDFKKTGNKRNLAASGDKTSSGSKDK